MFPSLIPPSPSSPLPALDWTPASRVRLQTRVPRQSVHERKIFVIRTRPKLVSVPNKPSNFSVRSSLRGLQFLGTRRRPPPPSPVPSIVRFSSPFPYSSFFPDLTSPTRFTRAPTLNTGPPAIVTRRERQKVSRIDPARKKLFPLFFSFYSSNPPPLSLSLLFFPRSVTSFSSFHPFPLLSPSPLRSFLPPPARSRFTILSGPPLSPTFIRGSTAQILLFCFPSPSSPPLPFVPALACKAGRGSRVFYPLATDPREPVAANRGTTPPPHPFFFPRSRN